MVESLLSLLFDDIIASSQDYSAFSQLFFDEFLTIEKSELLFLTFIGVAKQSCGSLKIVPYSHPKTKDWPE